MRTEEIPRDEWNNFFNSFSRHHEGWLATLEIFGSEIGAQTEAEELPLEGVSINSGGTESATIAISVGKTAQDHISHTIVNPAHVWLEHTDEGASGALEIEANDQSKTLLRFRSPAAN